MMMVNRKNYPAKTTLTMMSLHWMPKLSAEVKYSLASPENCLVIFPTS